MLGLIGKKVGMTQLFDEDGMAVPVTAIEAGPCPIVQVKTDERDGYRAIQLGFGLKKPRRANKPALGHVARAGLSSVPSVLREFRLSGDDVLADDPHKPAVAPEAVPEEPEVQAPDAEVSQSGAADDGAPEAEAGGEPKAAEASEGGLRVGGVLTVLIFEPGERVRVTGRSKGRGFQGVVKRHGFAGFPKTHGHSADRVPGSVGPGTDPSRVIKGRRMAGRMGGKRRTVRNLQIFRVDPERNLIFVKGAVPGARNGLVLIRKQ